MTKQEAERIIETSDPLTDGWSIADAQSFLEGFQAGRESMAEEAAKIIDDHYWDISNPQHGKFLAEKIRNLAKGE